MTRDVRSGEGAAVRQEEERFSSPQANQDNDIVALIFFFLGGGSLKIEFEDPDAGGRSATSVQQRLPGQIWPTSSVEVTEIRLSHAYRTSKLLPRK